MAACPEEKPDMRITERNLPFIIVCIGIPIIFMLMPASQPFMFATLGIFSHAMLWLVDCLFGGPILSTSPVIMWSIAGAVIGGCIGFWSIAPAIGKRGARNFAQVLPFALLSCFLIIGVLSSLSSTTPPPPLRSGAHPVDAAMSQSGSQPNSAATTSTAQSTASTSGNEQPPNVYTTPTEDTPWSTQEGGGAAPKDYKETHQLGDDVGQHQESMNPLDHLPANVRQQAQQQNQQQSH